MTIEKGQRRISKAPEMENDRTRFIVVGDPVGKVAFPVSFADGTPWCDMTIAKILERYPTVVSA